MAGLPHGVGRSSPPPTRRQPLVEEIHGLPVADPYRWLEDGDDPEVGRWTEEQDRFTRALLERAPSRAGIRARLEQLLAIGTISPPVPRRGRYFYLKRTGSPEQPVLYTREGRDGSDRTLLDPTALAVDSTTALDWYYPSPDGRLVAYGTSEAGSEESKLRVREVGSGRDLPDRIPRTRACSLEWRPDASGFYYTRYPEPGTVPPGEEHYRGRVFLHILGQDFGLDVLVFGPGRPPEDWPRPSTCAAKACARPTGSRSWAAATAGSSSAPPSPSARSSSARSYARSRSWTCFATTASASPGSGNPEYGSPEDSLAFRWLLAYSPYHRVVDGTAYPAALLTAGESDSRVDPMHARKMAARLQAATASGRPVPLRLERRAGHGQGKPLSKLVDEWTDVWSFLLTELGLQ